MASIPQLIRNGVSIACSGLKSWLDNLKGCPHWIQPSSELKCHVCRRCFTTDEKENQDGRP